MYCRNKLSVLALGMIAVVLLDERNLSRAGEAGLPVPPTAEATPERGSPVTADPAATHLLAEARAARLTWTNFPGFRAQVTVNLNGTVSVGTVVVSPTGRVEVQGLPEAAQKWVRRTLGSAVSHRLAAASGEAAPCVFGDSDSQHPLGRLVRVLHDELHTHYRIKDRQITEVQRNQDGSRFTITVLANQLNEAGKYLPSAFIVHWWDGQTGALVRSEGHTQTWQRVGAFDLPCKIRVVLASRTLQTFELDLGQVQLGATSSESEVPPGPNRP